MKERKSFSRLLICLLLIALFTGVFASCKTNENTLTGRTDGGKVVNFEGSDELIGNMIDLEITEQRKWYLTGKIKVQ